MCLSSSDKLLTSINCCKTLYQPNSFAHSLTNLLYWAYWTHPLFLPGFGLRFVTLQYLFSLKRNLNPSLFYINHWITTLIICLLVCNPVHMDTFKTNHNYIYIWFQIKLGVRITTYTFFKLWISKIFNNFLYIYIYMI